MEQVSHLLEIQKQFGYAKVLWEIQNYLSGTCKKDWIIHSPDFSVTSRPKTRWRLFLKPKYVEDNYKVYTYLERIDSFPEAVRVKWKLSFPTGESEHVIPEVASVFEMNTIIKKEISGIDVLENHMRSNLCNTFVIRCRMIVYSKESYEKNIPSDLGLKRLSQDLAVLCKLGRWSDVTFFVGQAISAHKAILSIRNSFLNSEIAKLGDDIELDYAWVKQDTLENLITFLYTGNVDYVLRTPSLTIHQLINYLNVSELKSYFTEDEILLRTSFGMREFVFDWIIPNISLVEGDYLSSPHWRLEILNTTFQLCLHLKESDKSDDHISIFGEFLKGETPKEAYLECLATSGNDKILGCKHLPWSSGETRKLGFEKFISKDILKDSTFFDQGSLKITCKLRIPTGNQSNSIVCSKTCFLVTTEQNQHYEQLAKDMEILFENGHYSDFTVSSRIISYKVHKAILISRSHVFGKIILNAKDETSVTFPDVDAYILRMLLHYIYTGTLRNCEMKQISELYAAADRFYILSLKYKCSQILQENLKIQNVFEFLTLAHKCKDFKLKFSAFKFFCCNVNKIHGQEKWCSYVEENQLLKKEFINFIKRIIAFRNQKKLEETGISKIEDFIKLLNSING